MLQDAVERIKGVGEKTAALFHKMNILHKGRSFRGFSYFLSAISQALFYSGSQGEGVDGFFSCAFRGCKVYEYQSFPCCNAPPGMRVESY